MSDTTIDDIEDEDALEPEDDERDEPAPEKKNDRTAEKARKDRLALAAARKELAFAKRGVDTDSKFGQYLLDTFKGEPTAEAIDAHVVGARKELGLPESTETPAEETKTEEPEISDEEKRSTDERRALAEGATPDTGEGVDPYADARQRQMAHVAAGGKKEEGLAVAIRAVREAGEHGESRVLYKPPSQ